MSALLLSPHNDDAALFAAFTCFAERPHVITVLRSVVQEQRGTGITAMRREAEDEAGMAMLGCRWEQWPYRDDDPDWKQIAGAIFELASRDDPTVVYAPMPEDGGHPHHNRLGELAAEAFRGRCRLYATYTNRGKSTAGQPVTPISGGVAVKLAALACYRSQSDLPNCQPHFLRGLEEYLT